MTCFLCTSESSIRGSCNKSAPPDTTCSDAEDSVINEESAGDDSASSFERPDDEDVGTAYAEEDAEDTE